MNKTGYIGIGFGLGLVVGITIALLLGNGPGDEAVEIPLSDQNGEEGDVSMLADLNTDEGTLDIETTNNDDVVAEPDQEIDQDTLVNDSITTMEIMFADTLVDDVDDIIILEDRLVGARQVDIRYIDIVEEGMSEGADSALAAHLDIREDDRPSAYEIEFWNSPINYAGYRLGKNKLILFGIGVADTIDLYGMDETVYLSTPKGLYELNRCDQFEKLRIIVDEDFVSSIVNED